MQQDKGNGGMTLLHSSSFHFPRCLPVLQEISMSIIILIYNILQCLHLHIVHHQLSFMFRQCYI